MSESKMYIPSQSEMETYLTKHDISVRLIKDDRIILTACPFCGSGEGGRDAYNSGCSIEASTGLFQCWRKEKCGAKGTWKTFQKLLLLRDTGLLDDDIRCGAEEITLDVLKQAQTKATEQGLIVTDYLDKTIGNGQAVDMAQVAAKKEQERQNRDYNIINAEDLRTYELTGDNYEYLVNTRKISPEVIKAYNIIDDPAGQEGAILFPHLDMQGEKMLFGKLRLLHPEESPIAGLEGKKEITIKDTSPHFFGLQHLGHGANGLVITEGQIDALSALTAGAWEAGYDVLSVPLGKNNFSFATQKEIDIIKAYDNVIVFGDLEDGKVSMVNDIEKMIDMPVSVIPVDKYAGYKDANDILKNLGATKLIEAIQSAKTYAPHKVSIADVDLGEEDDRLLFLTGYDEIDRMVGGITAGKLILLAAREGVGKSTLALNMAIRAADAGVKTYIYSGEMSQKDIVRDLILQAAGPCKTTWAASNESCCHKPTLRIPAHKEPIIRWLSEYIALHQPDPLDVVKFGTKAMLQEASKTVNDLIEDVEREARRHTAEFFIIDNMMILLSQFGESSDLFAAQGLLAQECKRICNTYNVTIMLCVHSRKESSYKGYHLTTDSISGSSTPKNMADIVFGLEKYEYDWDEEGKSKKEDKISHTWDDLLNSCKMAPSTILRVLKNRRGGLTHRASGEGVYDNRDLGIELNAEGCFLWYHRQSKSLLDLHQMYAIRSKSTEALAHGWEQYAEGM